MKMNFGLYILALSILLTMNAWQCLAGGGDTKPLDVLFLIDGSGSVRPRNFNKIRKALKTMIDRMYIDKFFRDANHVALIQFSSKELTKVEFNLDTYDTKEDMKTAIDDMVYQRKYTYTGHAMKMAQEQVFNGRDGDRPEAKNVVILFTDGHSADPHVADAATTEMKANGDHVITVGFGRRQDRFKDELQKLATDKEKDVFFGLGDDDVNKIEERLLEAAFLDDNSPQGPRIDCSRQPCLNNGLCVDASDGYYCKCTSKWEGRRCENKRGPCSINRCENDGVCQPNGDDFTCQCGEKFHGQLCEIAKVVCTTKNVDILVIMDDSRSIGNADYDKMKNFTIELVNRFDVSRYQSHVALMQFSKTADIQFHLSRYYDKNALVNRIKILEHRKGSKTNTHFALKLAREEIFNNKRGDRSSVRDVIVLLTDGSSHDNAAAITEAGLLRDDDVSIIPIGVGKAEDQDKLYQFLRKLSLDSDYVFKVSYTELDTILDGVTRAACENLQET